jgi:CBS domain-containing protein
MGFDAYDYAAGKVDWLAAGLPTVQAEPLPRRALEEADRDPPTCTPQAVVGDLADPALVVNEHGVVLGRVEVADHPPSARAEDVMTAGPATVRANEPLDALVDRMQRRKVHEVVVTTPEGRLLGVVRRPS